MSDTPTIKDSGERRSFSTGAVRDKVDGKGRNDLLPGEALASLCHRDNNEPYVAADALHFLWRFLADPTDVAPLNEATLILLNILEYPEDDVFDLGDPSTLPSAIEAVAKHFEAGAKKYAARNWEQGINVSAFIDSACRHTGKVVRGDDDEPHLAAAAWNCLCAIQTIQWVQRGVLPKELFDLPVRLTHAADKHLKAEGGTAIAANFSGPTPGTDAAAEAAYRAKAEEIGLDVDTPNLTLPDNDSAKGYPYAIPSFIFDAKHDSRFYGYGEPVVVLAGPSRQQIGEAGADLRPGEARLENGKLISVK